MRIAQIGGVVLLGVMVVTNFMSFGAEDEIVVGIVELGVFETEVAVGAEPHTSKPAPNLLGKKFELRRWPGTPRGEGVNRACGEHFVSASGFIRFMFREGSEAGEQTEAVQMFTRENLRTRQQASGTAPTAKVLAVGDTGAPSYIEIGISPEDMKQSPCLADLPHAV